MISSCAEDSKNTNVDLNGTWAMEFGVLDIFEKSNIPILIKENGDSVLTKQCGQVNWTENTRVDNELFENDVKRYKIVDQNNMIAYIRADEITEFDVHRKNNEIALESGVFSLDVPGVDSINLTEEICSYAIKYKDPTNERFLFSINMPHKENTVRVSIGLIGKAAGTYFIYELSGNSFNISSEELRSHYSEDIFLAYSGEIEITSINDSHVSGSYSVVLLNTDGQIVTGEFDVTLH